MQRAPHHIPICWITNTIRLYGLTKMLDLGIGLFRAHKNTDVAWRVLVCSCAAFSLLKVYYYFNYKDLSNVAKVDLNHIKSEHPLSINERLLEHEGVCDAMHVFLPRDPYSKQPEEPPCECCHQYHHVKPKTTEVNLLKTLVIELMLVFVLYLGMTALLDVFKESKKETAEETDARLSRRCSLAEYANMKHSRKNSLAIGSAQSFGFLRRDSVRPKPTLNRYESLGTAYTRMRRESLVAGTQNLVTANETPNTPPHFVARTPLKLLGARPPPLIRRSSFPANILLEGQVQGRRGSMDSEDDSSPDSRRRCRLIRRH